MSKVQERINKLGYADPHTDYYITIENAFGSPENVKGLKNYICNKLDVTENQIELTWERMYSGVNGITVYDSSDASSSVMYLSYDEVKEFNLEIQYKNNLSNLAREAISSEKSNFICITREGNEEIKRYIKSIFSNFPDIQVSLVNKGPRTEANVTYFDENLNVKPTINRKDFKFKCSTIVVDENLLNYQSIDAYKMELNYANDNADIVIFEYKMEK